MPAPASSTPILHETTHGPHKLGDIARLLNRSVVFLRGLQDRFDLPVPDGGMYSHAYHCFFRKVVFLRALGIPEESLRELWRLEKKLLQLLHVDATGSPTWFLDACCRTTHPRRRLLLTNHDMGVALPSRAVQLGLNFTTDLPELFADNEMGEDELRILGKYLRLFTRIQADVRAELPVVRAAASWSFRLNGSFHPGKDGGRRRPAGKDAGGEGFGLFTGRREPPGPGAALPQQKMRGARPVRGQGGRRA